jgi:multidrug resistance efflux pump
MMKEKKIEILYSDHVNDIISNPPKRIVRWGTALIFIVFLLLSILAWFIKYPDIIPAPVEITTFNPPVTLASKITGRINKLYVTDGEKVASGKLLAVMETAASVHEFELLKTVTDPIQSTEGLSAAKFPLFSGLGELQPYYASFLRTLSDYNSYVSNDFYGYKISSLSEEIDALQEYLGRLNVKKNLISENLKLEEKKYDRDSTLFQSKVISESDYENSKQVYNKGKLTLQEVRLEQSAKTIDLSEKRQLLQDYRIKREEERQKLASSLNETWQNLKAQIRIWENTYLLVSPVEGTVTFTKFWSENQSVMTDEPVLSVVPENAGDFIGRINLNMQRSGKVRISQSVNIKLSGYPYLEYGMVRGIVRSKSLVPAGNAYVIEVALPEGLTTLYGKKLEFNQNMQGTAEILTDDLRLLQKIINPFRHLISKNRNL